MGVENKKVESVSECDVGLGLRMQSTESFPHKSMTVTPQLPYSTLLYHHHSYKKESNTKKFISSSCFESMSSDRTSTGAAGYGFGASDGSGGGPLYCNLSSNDNSRQVVCLSDLYDVVGASGEGSVQRTFQPLANTSDSYPKSSGGMRGNDNNNNNKGISAFTVRQWEELERQIMICKYMMASIPVPPQLLLNLFNNTSSAVSTSQSNHNSTSCRLDVRYTRGGGSSNYSEPWRCRRTDGKKWRCSRNVAPYQKYCERHAHKPRPRSRKPVEPQQQQECHITTTANVGVNSINNNNSTPHQALQSQVFNIPAMISGPTYAQPRCTEWFMKGDPAPGSALNEAWQQLVQPSLSEGLKLYDEHNRTVSVFQKRYEDEQESIHTNTYLCTNDDSSFQNRLNFDHQTQTTRHFIDAWSCADRQVEIGHISDQTPLSLSGKLPLSSLTLSMSGGTEIDDENKNVQLGVGMMMMTDLEGGNERGFKTDWLSSNPYSCLPPGGPLGEALCLGISSTGKGQSNLPSPHGYSNSTTTSSCSKSS